MNSMRDGRGAAATAVTAALMMGAFVVFVGNAAAQQPPARPTFLSGQILVQFQPGTPAAVEAAIHRAQGATVRRVIRGIDVRVVAVPRGTEAAKVAAYSRNPNVLYAEPDYLHQPLNGPNDPGFNLKWDLHNTGQCSVPRGDCATPDADIDWHEAYQALATTALSAVTIAMVDTGADLLHPDLSGKIIAGWDFVGNGGATQDPDPTDEDGHGTHTSGIAAATTNNGLGTAGVAFDGLTHIMPLRVCLPEGCPVSAMSEAYIFAADNGARAINISIGGLYRSRTEASAVKYAWQRGAVLVASAGNLGQYINAAEWKHYPAAYPEVMAVSATNYHDVLAYYSSHGNWLSVAAPGGEMAAYHDTGGIYSTMPTYQVTLTTNFRYSNNYDQLQGTSMSAPQVAGLAALLFAVNPTLTNSDVRSIIETTADDLGAAGFDNLFGYGRINAYAAVQAVLAPGAPPAGGTCTAPPGKGCNK